MKNILAKLRPKLLTIIGVFLLLLYAVHGPLGTYLSAHAESVDTDTRSIISPPSWPIDTEKFPAVAIKSINPGYNSNTGELIELVRLVDKPVDLAGVTIKYHPKSATSAPSYLYTFPEGSKMVEDTIILRYSGSAEGKESFELDATYKKSLAFEAGPLQLIYNNEVFDSVCWTGTDCYDVFKSKTPTTLVRNLETGEFAHVGVDEYEVVYKSGLVIETIQETAPDPQCTGLEFSEVLTYYESDASEQFIELYNGTDSRISMDGCTVAYKNKTINLSGAIESASFTVLKPEFTLTKNPSSTNKLEIIDINGDTVDTLIVEHGQKKAASLAQFGYSETGEETWQQTYQQTPGEQNLYQEYRSCESGKVINTATGNCVKATTLASTVKECKEGQYRNPETGRCKSISSSTTSECKEGYERNPETNRCRKITTNTGANYGMETREYEQKSVFMAMGAVIVIIALGAAYIVFQFRSEIRDFSRKIWGKITGKPVVLSKKPKKIPKPQEKIADFKQKLRQKLKKS